MRYFFAIPGEAGRAYPVARLILEAMMAEAVFVPEQPTVPRTSSDVVDEAIVAGSVRPNGPRVPGPEALAAVTVAPPVQVPQPTRDPSWYRPVFVLAPARSNSSVVSAMIGMHPELYGFPELCLFRGATVRDLITDRPGARGLAARARSSGLARAVAQLHDGQQDEASVAAARQWLASRQDWNVAHVLDHLLAIVAPLTGFEKSPENSNRQDYLERLDQSFPRARFVHLTRHPVKTAQSMYAAWSKLGLWDVPEALLYLHLLGTWMFQHATIRRFTEALPPDRWMRVRSEDILNKPEETLPQVCRWIGVDASEEAIQAMVHPEQSPFARVGPRNALGGNDPGFLEHPEPRKSDEPTSLDLPPEWKVDPWTHVALIDFAATIGYRHSED